MTFKRFLFLFFFLSGSVGAMAQKKAAPEKDWERYMDSLRKANPYAQITYDTLVSRVYAQQHDYHSLSARTKLIWEDGSTQQDFQASIRMRKDSLIWGSLSGAMGVEGARIMITPDTFVIINKLQGEYACRPFSFLQSWLLFPVSFKMLQQVLAGQKVDISETASAAFLQDSLYVLYYETDKLQEKIWVKPENYTITKMLLKDKLLLQDMTITFDAYNDLNGKPFAYKRRVEIVRGPQNLKLQTEVTRIVLNEAQAYPFEITDRLKKME